MVLALVFPLRAALYGYRRLVRAPEGDVPRVRMALYREAIALQWLLAAATIALWTWRGREWALLGLAPRLTPAGVALAILAAGAVAFVALQRRRTLASRDALAQVRTQLRHVERMLPRSGRELRWFLALSLTAGLCEELLYRGYLIAYLERGIGLVPAVIVGAMIFGFGHLYQGRRGMLTTALVGLVFGVIFRVSGSLWIAMALHALADAHSGHLAWVAWRREPVDEEPLAEETGTSADL